MAWHRCYSVTQYCGEVLREVDIGRCVGLSENQHRAQMHRGVRAFQAQERQVQRRQTLSDHRDSRPVKCCSYPASRDRIPTKLTTECRVRWERCHYLNANEGATHRHDQRGRGCPQPLGKQQDPPRSMRSPGPRTGPWLLGRGRVTGLLRIRALRSLQRDDFGRPPQPVGGQWDLPAGGHQVGIVAVTEGERPPGATALRGHRRTPTMGVLIVCNGVLPAMSRSRASPCGTACPLFDRAPTSNTCRGRSPSTSAPASRRPQRWSRSRLFQRPHQVR
jgi:hypothetical protein